MAFFNPGQTPVIAANQPLYALLKQIQWEWSEYGEDKFIKMFGGLHIEMAALKSIGTLLEDSGWISAIVAGGVASSGTAESFLTASSVTRTRLAHQITACTLYKLMRGPYEDYCSENISTLSFDKNQPTPASVTVGSFTHARSHSRLRFFKHRWRWRLPDTDPKGEVIIVDGSALINAIPLRGSKTFDNYVRKDILPKVNANTRVLT